MGLVTRARERAQSVRRLLSVPGLVVAQAFGLVDDWAAMKRAELKLRRAQIEEARDRLQRLREERESNPHAQWEEDYRPHH